MPKESAAISCCIIGAWRTSSAKSSDTGHGSISTQTRQLRFATWWNLRRKLHRHYEYYKTPMRTCLLAIVFPLKPVNEVIINLISYISRLTPGWNSKSSLVFFFLGLSNQWRVQWHNIICFSNVMLLLDDQDDLSNNVKRNSPVGVLALWWVTFLLRSA